MSSVRSGIPELVYMGTRKDRKKIRVQEKENKKVICYLLKSG